MLIVIALIGIVSAMAMPNFAMMITTAKADGATAATLSAMRVARDRAIAERRNFQVIFTLPNKIEVVRQEIPSGTTPITTTFLEQNQTFMLTPSLPDSPDAFGNSTAIAFLSTPMAFTSEGTVVDTTGDPLNGTIFIGLRGKELAARAITVRGTTAALHAYRWDGSRWVD
jgi:type II secretory pathway pseudopilin PulG